VDCEASVKILVVDVGGTGVKMLASGQPEPRRFDSGTHLTPKLLVDGVREQTDDWEYDVIALGLPGRVGPDGPEDEPGNLGEGWVGFDFAKAFGKPVKVMNDAALQALGGYDGGRMLFLGLGTGLGSALVCDHVVIPLELGDLACGPSCMLSDRLGKRGLEEDGEAKWKRHVAETAENLRMALRADYVVLGGGNAERLDKLPEGVRCGGNDDAFEGGFRIWDERIEPHDSGPLPSWRVVR
jgi:predicted NBD/HSP70 family sugar kinase